MLVITIKGEVAFSFGAFAEEGTLV